MKNAIWYGICQLYKRKIITLLTIAMLLLCFIILEYSGLLYMTYRYSEWKAKDVICYDYDDVYNINLSKYVLIVGLEEFDKLTDFYESIKHVEGIECYGTYYEEEYDGFSVLYLSEGLAGLCNLNIDYSENKETDMGRGAVGMNLSSRFPVGSVYYDAQTGYEYRIMQTLEEGSRFISDQCFDQGPVIADLDNYIVINYDDLISMNKIFLGNGLNEFFFAVSDEADADAVCQAIWDTAAKCGIDIYGINSLEVLFDRLARDAASDLGERYMMPFVLLVCSVISMAVASLISMRTNRRDTGIMLANNMTRIDIVVIYVTENIIKIFFAYILSALFWYSKADAFLSNTREILMYLIPLYLLVAIVVIGISSLAPVFFIKKRMPCDLIGEDYD